MQYKLLEGRVLQRKCQPRVSTCPLSGRRPHPPVSGHINRIVCISHAAGSADHAEQANASQSSTEVAPVAAATLEQPAGEAAAAAGPVVDDESPVVDVEGEWETIAAFPEPPLSTNRAAALQYGALGAAYAVVGGAMAVAALRAPALLLPGAAAADPAAAALLGCVAAGQLRAAGLCLHMKAAADRGELLCWRHQRLAAGLAAYGAAAVGVQALGTASAQLAGLHLALGAASLAVAVGVARSVWGVRPFVSAAFEGTELGQGVRELACRAAAACGSVAGILLLGCIGLSLYGFGATVLSAAPPPPTPLGAWPAAAAAAGTASVEALRRAAGCGLLLAGGVALGLLDFAAGRGVRRPANLADMNELAPELVERLARQRDPYSKYYLAPDPQTYGILNLSYIAAAVLQAVVVVGAPAAGVDVNWDGGLWGPLYGTWMLGLSYGLVAAARVDWELVAGGVTSAFCLVGGWVINFFGAFVWKFEWAEKMKRA